MNKRPETLDDIRRSIAEIEKLITADKERRVSLGLPPSRPPYFVKASHGREMVKRARVIVEVLTTYLRMTHDAKALIPFPIVTFDKHTDLLTLLKWSEEITVSRYADLLLSCIDVIKDEGVTYEKVVTQLYYNLDLANKFLDLDNDPNLRESKFEGTAEELDAIIEDYQRHYDEVVAPALAHEADVFAKAGEDD